MHRSTRQLREAIACSENMSAPPVDGLPQALRLTTRSRRVAGQAATGSGECYFEASQLRIAPEPVRIAPENKSAQPELPAGRFELN